jgi:hypothetical protein
MERYTGLWTLTDIWPNLGKQRGTRDLELWMSGVSRGPCLLTSRCEGVDWPQLMCFCEHGNDILDVPVVKCD